MADVDNTAGLSFIFSLSLGCILLVNFHRFNQRMLSAGNKCYILGLEHLGSGVQMAASNPPIRAVRLVHP